jgi:stage V sporulation protein B
LLILFAPTIGHHWIRDARAVIPLRILGVSLPFIALSACLSGYFVAVRRVYKSASVQLPEEVIRIALTLLLLDRLSRKGLEGALLALALSATLADIISGIALTILYLLDRKRHFPTMPRDACSVSYAAIARELLGITLPVAIAAYARS